MGQYARKYNLTEKIKQAVTCCIKGGMCIGNGQKESRNAAEAISRRNKTVP